MVVLGRYLCIYYLIVASITLEANAKIEHVVVLMEENRSFDHMFGYLPGVNGLTGKEYNLVDTTDPKSKRVYVDDLEPYVAPCDPDHGTPATTSKIFGAEAVKKNDFSNATMSGFVEWENKRGNAKTNYCDVMSMLSPEHVPIISTLANEFAIMDRFFAAYPGPTWPNRLFMLTATSAGLTSTGPWYHGQLGQLFPQETFFDQLDKEGMTWRNYYNDTPWELMLAGISHNPEHLAPMGQFFADARDGTLPSFSWLNPRSGINITLMQGSNDHHPDHDIAQGEQYMKDIYESLRSSPKWNETLFIITYDEHGGYYDHVPPPSGVPPPGDGEASYPDKGVEFNRLGIRIPTVLISPLIPKGTVLSHPPAAQKPESNSEYTLTSIMATVRKLFGMKSGPLTKRDAWSATFEQVFSQPEPRTDCPVHLPPAPRPSYNYSPEKEALMPVNELQEHIMTVHAHLAGVEFPHHVKHQGKMGEWAQSHYHKHARKTKHWKLSKTTAAEYDLVLQPRTSPKWVTGGAAWDVNRGTNVKFFTISTRTKLDLCFDYGKPVENSIVTVSKCYPSAEPNTNRDTAQQWVWGNDATFRPYANTTLCLTNNYFNNDEKLYLKTCVVTNVQQHWAWHGPAAGADNNGMIYFGDYTNSIGIIAK